ncbi:MAG TPA: helix-turn-helix transcriptional regulator [Candidatus Sumerlaeota bacterium]|nr:MAG: hypothetical protein BWZ08_00254 [candidate division BRC1 bacterium ADurb.BinA292]HOE95878.1 helix-turn-helix transcriptional regulator [Candidatus Sumerlaeota bacterium]HOR27798.1 helix-turn-helix transcriptional regulator [Candidatus Sumerlaeota bacterium]HPK03150.1 helix-turn-helix transcriptional regulator [Candidatus Sumerlaeota bacterium]
MQNYLGEIIYATRLKLNLTQTEYGQQFNVSGPAIFKFEKGYVRPSLKLWLDMARQAGISERRAVLIWVKRSLPERYRDYIGLEQAYESARRAVGRQKDYSRFTERAELLREMEQDPAMPEALRQFVRDDENWALYKPTGEEINKLRDVFGPLGAGTRELYRDALRVVREFV